jgi:hypothetical protein
MRNPTPQYVCWVDVMGARSSMLRSLSIAANFVMKLHIAALTLRPDYPDITLYPMIDGLYGRSPRKDVMLSFLNRLFFRLALAFLKEPENLHKFCVRGGVAFGPVVTGDDILDTSDTLSKNGEYCKSILLGITLTQAFDVARSAAPFGIALHESARAFAPAEVEVLSGSHSKWWHFIDDGDKLIELLKSKLMEYQKWCKVHSATMIYAKDRIQAHMELVEDFLSD